MIITIFLLIKELVEFARKYNLKKGNISINLIQSSTCTSATFTESMVVFMNCQQIFVSGADFNNELESGHYQKCSCCLKSQKLSRRLNTINKMECEEDGHKNLMNGIISLKGNLTSPKSDCNSNNLTVPKENMFLCSTDSIQDCSDFLQDNSEYQWFLDYGYKCSNSHHQSVLSLTKSQDLIYCDDMARNIDANLAEVDMDDFNREDIHSVLSSLPNIQGAEEREMFASVTSSMMVKFDFDSCFSPQSNSQEEQINTSICKSQLLFSPVRENYLPNSSLSVDSLDLSENDINLMVTCQSNKNNYTIAFEGSTVMTSDDREMCFSRDSKPEENRKTQFDVCEQSHGETSSSNSRDALVTSDLTFTTWSKIKGSPSENLNLKRHRTENNNSSFETFHFSDNHTDFMSFKSLSLPNLFRSKQKHNASMSLSLKVSKESARKFSLNNDQGCVKLYDIQGNSKNSDSSRNPTHNFSLVKLFIKQKSASHEGMSNYSPEQTVFNDNFKNTKNIENHRDSGTITDVNKLIPENCFENSSSAKTGKLSEDRLKTKYVDLKSEKKNISNSLYENLDYEKKISRNGYYSDESAQENGSNTESAENLTCDCVSSPFHGSKKLLTEKSIQTSKVLDSTSSNEKKPSKVPVYILYPNYSLPNLEFLKKDHYIQNIDFSKVFLRPQKFQMVESPVVTPKGQARPHGKRPFSVNDIETLKKTGFKHVKDWESLTFLLPKEYKQFLQEIPEIVAHLKDVKNSKDELVPLFCLSPPPSRRVRKHTSNSDINISNESRYSNFSSTTTQPSSGYRGSSTMLNSNNSCHTNSPRNPSFSYKYDLTSDLGSRKSGSFSQNKNYSVNSDDSNENCSQRPPLPKSILRNNSLDSHQYTCKTQKEYANKRYSMVELTDKNLVPEEKSHKRRSLQNSSSKLPQAYGSRIIEQRHSSGDVQVHSNKAIKNIEKNDKKSNLENDLRRLEELLEISSVFGESVESFTETDMMKLRSQVSKFLTMQKNLEKVSETLQTVDGEKTNGFSGIKNKNCEETLSLAVNHSQTPHNTPEHKKQSKNRTLDLNNLQIRDYLKPCNCSDEIHEFQEGDCKFKDENLGSLKKTVSFAEKISFAVKEHELCKEKVSNITTTSQKNNQVKVKRPMDLPICEESSEGILNDSSTANILQNSADFLHKRDLVLDVGKAAKKILKLCKETEEDPANICLHHLCPSLYAVLSDGLKEEIDTPFGPIRNSVWSVIEASSQQGPMTQTLNELVQRLNRDDIFTEGLIKFNAFIFGLLNSRALSGWLSYLRTRDGLLHKYYENSGLMLLSNTAGAPVRNLVDHLVSIIEPLGALEFNLDLMYQTKLLHCSLQNLNCLLEEPCNNDFLTPTKQFMLLKLVQSIQNSLSQSGEGKKSKHILEDIEEKTSDPPLGHLLEKNKSVRIRRGGSKTRPRSGCDSVGPEEEKTDIAGAMKKRWSGINLNSKLTEAFDRLVDDSESDYTDSLNIASPRLDEKVRKEKNGNILTEDLELDKNTKEQKRNILLHLNKKSFGKIEDCKTESEKKELLDNTVSYVKNSGEKFKRLQRKWERWEKSGGSPSDSDSEIQSPSSEVAISHKEKVFPAKTQKSEKPSCDISNTILSPTSRISKIPRLVTSPLSSVPGTKPAANTQKLVSPTFSNESDQKGGKSNSWRENGGEVKFTVAEGNRPNRVEEKSEPVSRVDSGKKQVVPKTGFPQKKCYAALPKKNDSVLKRASSMSLNRKPAAKKLHQAQRTVRTLTHRLPSDSGHLSFNEGERLKVVLEVDKAWLLCCRGNQKGLVPKSLVISDVQDKF